MKRLLTVSILMVAVIMLIAPAVFAEEAKAVAAGNPNLSYYGMAVLGCGLAIGLAALGTGIGMGHGLRGATEGTARNPGVSGKIMTTLIIGIAMIESLAIYALVVVLIVLYANPFKI